MLYRVLVSKSLVVVAIAILGCGGESEEGGVPGTSGIDPDPVDLTQAFCLELDECNEFEGSVEDCTFVFDECVDALPPSRRRDWETDMNACLEFDSCRRVIDCWLEVPDC